MRIVGLVLTLLLLWFGAHEGMEALWSPVALAMVVCFTIWGFLGAAGPLTATALRVTFSGAGAPVDELGAGYRALRASRFTTLAGGLAASVTGFVMVLRDLAPTRIGPGMALGLLGLLYAVCIAYFIVLPLEANVQRRLATGGSAQKEAADNAVDLLVLLGTAVFTAIMFGLLYFVSNSAA